MSMAGTFTFMTIMKYHYSFWSIYAFVNLCVLVSSFCSSLLSESESDDEGVDEKSEGKEGDKKEKKKKAQINLGKTLCMYVLR